MAIFAALILVIIILNELKTYFAFKSEYDSKQYSIVEGRVQDFEALRGKSGRENFRVDSLYFSIDESDLGTFGPEGNIIKPNLYVRIHYPTYGRICILRLETE